MLFTKKSILYTTCLLGLTSLTSQSALASSSYSSFAEIQYTITASNQNNSGSLIDLDISDDILAYAAEASLSSSHMPVYNPYSGLNISHTNSLAVQDSISNGTAISEYYAEFELNFKNLSLDINDIFDITIDYTYTLSADTSGEFANTEIYLAAENAKDDEFDFQEIFAATNISPNFDELIGSDQYSFSLAAGQTERIYLETFIGGNLEASNAPAPVPLPTAFWMFGSALMAFPGIRKLQRKTA